MSAPLQLDPDWTVKRILSYALFGKQGICAVRLDGFLLLFLLEEITRMSSRAEQLDIPTELFCVSNYLTMVMESSSEQILTK